MALSKPITPFISPPDTGNLTEMEEYYKAVIKQAEVKLNEIRDFRERIAETDVVTEHPKYGPIPAAYDKKLIWENKVRFAVSKIKAGVAQEIADYLLKQDSTLDKRITFEAVTYTASKLFRENVIRAKRVGRKYKYYM